MSDHSLYPLPPLNVPPDLTKPSGRYLLRVTLLLVRLGVFLILYLALIVGAAWFTYWALTYNCGGDGYTRSGRPRSGNPVLIPGLGLAGGMLTLFLLKGLFKGRREVQHSLSELSERD